MNYKIKKAVAAAAAFIIMLTVLAGPGGAGFGLPGTAVSASATVREFTASEAVKAGVLKLSPGGMPFGVKFFTDGVLIVGFCDIQTTGGSVNPAYNAGLRLKDVITSVNGETLTCATQLTTAIERSDGKPVTLTYKREATEFTVTLTPVFCESEGRYKTGIWVRDSGAGIGTVTFIVPSSGAFAGLGHGICDSDTGELIPMQRGTVTSVTISGLTRGISGDPGEIKGYFNSGKCGTLIGNTENGVYGIFTELPAPVPENALQVASREDVREGTAYIWCTLDTNEVRKYAVEISAINAASHTNKCFTVTVTDPALLEKTGGIIQGMSGSPIVQDGRLIGAVTHVLINDPARGYGIFIENMLDNMPELLR